MTRIRRTRVRAVSRPSSQNWTSMPTRRKLGEFNKAHSEKYDQARKLKGDARKAKLREITVARNALLDELLTGEQQVKLKELKAAKKGRKRESKDK